MFEEEESEFCTTTESSINYMCYHSKGGRVYPNEVKASEYENLFKKKTVQKIGEKSRSKRNSKTRDSLKIDSVFDYGDDSHMASPSLRTPGNLRQNFQQSDFENSRTMSEKIRAGKVQQRSTINMIKIIETDICDIVYRLKEKIERFGGYGCEYENGDLTCRSSESRSFKRFSSSEEYELNSLKLKAKALFFEGLNLVKTYYNFNIEYSTENKNFAYLQGMKNFVKKGVNFDNEVDCLEAVVKIKRKLQAVVKEYEQDWSEICSIMDSSEMIQTDFSRKKNSVKELDLDQEIKRRRYSGIGRSSSRKKNTAVTPRTRNKKRNKIEKKTSKKSHKKRVVCPEIEVRVTRRSRSGSRNNNFPTSKNISISPEKVITNERFERVENQLMQIMMKLEKMGSFKPNNENNKENQPVFKTQKETTLIQTIETKNNMKRMETTKEKEDIIYCEFPITTPKPFRTTVPGNIESPFKIKNTVNGGKVQSNTPNLVRKQNKHALARGNNPAGVPEFQYGFESVNEIDPINAFKGQKTESSFREDDEEETEREAMLCYKKPIIQPEIFITPPSSIYTGEIDFNQIPRSMNCSHIFYNSKGKKVQGLRYLSNNRNKDSEKDIHVLEGTLDGNNFTLQGKEDDMKEVEVEKMFSARFGKPEENFEKKPQEIQDRISAGENSKDDKEKKFSTFENSITASYSLSDVNSLEYEIFKVREERAEQLIKLKKNILNTGKFLQQSLTSSQAEEFINQNIFQLTVAISEFYQGYKFTSQVDKQLEKNLNILEKKIKKAKSLLNQSCLFEGETKENFIYGIYGLVEKSLFCFEKFVEMSKEQYDDILPISQTTTPRKRSSEEINKKENFEKVYEDSQINLNNLKTSQDIFKYKENCVELSGIEKKSKILSKSEIIENNEENLIPEENVEEGIAKSTAPNTSRDGTLGSYDDEKEGLLEVILEKNEKHETSSNLEIIDCELNSASTKKKSQLEIEEISKSQIENNIDSSVKIITMKGGFFEEAPVSSYYHTIHNSNFNLMSTNGATYQRHCGRTSQELKCRTSKTAEAKKNEDYKNCFREEIEERGFHLDSQWAEEFEAEDEDQKLGSSTMNIKIIDKSRFFASQKDSENSKPSTFEDFEDQSVQRRLDVPPAGFELEETETQKSEFGMSSISREKLQQLKVVKLDVKEGKGKINVLKLIPDSDKCVLGLSSGELIFYSISEKSTILCKKKHKGNISCIEYLKVNAKDVSNNGDFFYNENSEKLDSSLVGSEYREFIITGGDEQDRSIIVWDVETMKALKKFSGHKLLISSIKHIGDNATIASSSYDGKIALWDLSKKFTCVQLLENHKAPISSLYVNTAKNCLISGALDGEIIIWKIYFKNGIYDAISVKTKIYVKGHIIELGIAKTNPENILVLESDAKLRIYDFERGELKSVVKSEFPFIGFTVIEREEEAPLLYCVKKGCEVERFDSWGHGFEEEDEVSLLGNKVNETNIAFVREMFGFCPKNQILVKGEELFLVGFEKKKKRIVFRPIEFC